MKMIWILVITFLLGWILTLLVALVAFVAMRWPQWLALYLLAGGVSMRWMWQPISMSRRYRGDAVDKILKGLSVALWPLALVALAHMRCRLALRHRREGVNKPPRGHS